MNKRSLALLAAFMHAAPASAQPPSYLAQSYQTPSHNAPYAIDTFVCLVEMGDGQYAPRYRSSYPLMDRTINSMNTRSAVSTHSFVTDNYHYENYAPDKLRDTIAGNDRYIAHHNARIQEGDRTMNLRAFRRYAARWSYEREELLKGLEEAEKSRRQGEPTIPCEIIPIG